MLLHFDLVGCGPFCNGACLCLCHLKEKGQKKKRFLRCVGVEKGKTTLGKVSKVGG
jgi:hypothetical protein